MVVAPGGVVWDVGANVGSYTMLASALVGPRGHVSAFEPVQENLAYLNSHVVENALTNVVVHELAVYDKCGRVRFVLNEDRVLGRIDQGSGTTEVEAITLDAVLQDWLAPPPDVVKVDVEGGEVEVLSGAAQLLESVGPVLLLSTHGRAKSDACRSLLTNAGYEIENVEPDGSEIIAWPADKSLPGAMGHVR